MIVCTLADVYSRAWFHRKENKSNLNDIGRSHRLPRKFRPKGHIITTELFYGGRKLTMKGTWSGLEFMFVRLTNTLLFRPKFQLEML